MKGGVYNEAELINLPTELIYNILSFLPIKEVFNLKSVNQRLNDICENYIQNYISKRLNEGTLNDAIYLHSLPQYTQKVRPFLVRYLESKVNEIVSEFTQLVSDAGGPFSSNLLKDIGGKKYEILYRTNNRIIKISNIGPGNIMMCDIYSSIGGRRNADRQVLINDVKYILRTFVMDSLISMTSMSINLTEYNYEPGTYGILGPSNINIII